MGLFAFIMMVGNVLKELLPYLLAEQLPWETFFRLCGLLLPTVAVYALPMGVLTGVLLVLGRMSAQNEITAMRAAGLTLAYVARPIVWLALGGLMLGLVVNYWFMPVARITYKRMLADAVRQNPLSFIVPKTFVRDFPGVVLFVGRKESGNRLRDIWLWQLDKQQRVVRSGRAVSGDVRFDEAANLLVLTLREVTGEERNRKNPEDFSEPLQTFTSGEFPLELPLSRLFGQASVRQKPSWMTLNELLTERARLDAWPASTAPPDLALQRMRISWALNEKAATALAVLAFAVLAVPLGIKVSRKETSANLGVSLALVMSYYFLTICVGWLDNRSEWRPDLLIWLPSLLFLGIGGWLFRRMSGVRG